MGGEKKKGEIWKCVVTTNSKAAHLNDERHRFQPLRELRLYPPVYRPHLYRRGHRATNHMLRWGSPACVENQVTGVPTAESECKKNDATEVRYYQLQPTGAACVHERVRCQSVRSSRLQNCIRIYLYLYLDSPKCCSQRAPQHQAHQRERRRQGRAVVGRDDVNPMLGDPHRLRRVVETVVSASRSSSALA